MIILVAVIILSFLTIGICYRRYLIKRTKEDLRYEIMAEVQNQMEPQRMGGARAAGNTFEFEMEDRGSSHHKHRGNY